MILFCHFIKCLCHRNLVNFFKIDAFSNYDLDSEQIMEIIGTERRPANLLMVREVAQTLKYAIPIQTERFRMAKAGSLHA